MDSISQNKANYHLNPENTLESKYGSPRSCSCGLERSSSRDRLEADSASLGTYTKSSSPLDTKKTPNPQKIQGVRATRYTLQTSIRKLIMRKNDFASDEIISMDDYNELPRVVKCARTRIAAQVEIKKDKEFNKAFYSGLTVCGSVWSCPLCAAKIQETRRQEVANAIKWAYDNDLKAVMITFTTPHYEFQKCADLLSKMSKAFKYLRSGKAYQKFKEKYGYQGLIRGLETMYGHNGWHNHTHELWFVNKDADVNEMRSFLLKRWETGCDKQGLIPKGNLRKFREHSIDIQDNAQASDYLSKQDNEKYLSKPKWGADSEITSSGQKSSRSGTHPFQLAALYDAGYEKAGDLFIEYMEAFKGKAQLFWSRGLKKKVMPDQEELTDQEISELEPEEIQIIATIEHFAWQTILDNKARSQILDIAENEGEKGIDAWLKRYGLNQIPRY